MLNIMQPETRTPVIKLNQKEYRTFLISHLHRIYCAKTELVEKLPEIGNRANFSDLKQAIIETIDLVKLQIRRMKDIYILLDSHYQHESCIGLIGVLDEAFQSIGTPGERPELRDLSILFYMQHIESIEIASFNILMLVAGELQQPDIAQLLRECFEEAKEDKALFKAIMANYL